MTTSRELPDRPSLENLRKQAKTLHRQITAGDDEAIARARQHLPRLGGIDAVDVAQARVTLQEVQYIIAVEYGYGKWQDLLASFGEQRPKNWPRAIPIRPGLPNLEREAAMLHRAAQEGRSWCAQRFRKSVARLVDVPDDEIGGAGVTLEEARQVIANDYGYVSWTDLDAEVGRLHPVYTLESLAELEDAEVREVIVRVGRDRLAVAFKSVSDRFKDRFSANMTAEEWQALVEATEKLGPMPQTAVEAVQLEILNKFRSDDPLV
jgi:hypothetical protein